MNTLYVTTSLLAHSLSWALLCTLWQGLLVFGALYLLLQSLQGSSSRIRYALSYGAFATIFAWFANTWLTQYQKLKGTTIYITQNGSDSGITTTIPVTVTTSPTQGWMHQYMLQTQHYMPFIMLVYTIGLVFMLVRFLISIKGLKTLKTRGIVVCNSPYADFIKRWQEQLGISRKVRLLLSTNVSVPMMIGTLKPIILMPVATINHLTTDQVEAILLHELAHIKRHDYLLNILQAIVETVLFFNPFIWLISAIIRREREHCCDDLVISCSANPLPYARALALLENDRINDRSLALAASGHKNQLFNRIKRIMEMKKSSINYSRFTIILVAIIAITFTAGMLTITPSWAQKAKEEQKVNEEQKTGEKQDGEKKKKTVYKSKTVTIDSNGKRTVKEHSTTTGGSGSNDAKDDDDDDIRISVNDDDDNNAHTKIIIRKGGDDKWEEGNKMSKAIVISTNGVAEAMANIDFSEINAEVANATKDLDAIDWDKISEQVNDALAEIKMELNNGNLHKEISLEVKKELERSKESLEKTKIQLAHSRAAMASTGAYKSHPQVYTSDGDYETMLNKMEKDGLLDRNAKFKVEKQHDELYINGTRQSDDVYKKYKSYMKAKNVTIKGSKGSLTINVADDE